ncbi:MAG: CPBP family intramembrane metalloprotease [Spirulinaceae cyanobacterium RM2_2_10]|nr:CPBP family intramembrane metalloprotease [Spirulinaceae cyanobacterium SM2_1_0]NJO19088.1 CPBP family intramembrane metalloprotease [Spirulinaceae cyanobacterium RM2_2_10]
MTIKRLLLIALTVLAVGRIVLALTASFSEPQAQAQLELYQTNLVLRALDWQPPADEGWNWQDVRQTLLGAEPYAQAEMQYAEAREQVQAEQQQLTEQLAVVSDRSLSGQPVTDLQPSPAPLQLLQAQLQRLDRREAQLGLELGILQAVQAETSAAQNTWQQIKAGGVTEALAATASVLQALWQEPPQVTERAESAIEANLSGWFRDRARQRLYVAQAQSAELAALETRQQSEAQRAFVKLVTIGAVPLVGGVLGVGLAIALLVQLALRGKTAVLATQAQTGWTVPWDGEIAWQVIIVGFCFWGQFVLPLLLPLAVSALGISLVEASLRVRATYILVSYLCLALGALGVLYLSIRAYLPLPADWFRPRWLSRWPLWGVGGYLVAIPLVLLVSLLNQQIWQGKGGSNPLIFLALQADDAVALAIFFGTAAIAAPIFEEIIFRGFLLPSLTRYLSVTKAILLSSLIFAIAHLSLSEVLPLMTLGMILGVVYTRSRSLLASVLLHSLWNSGTLISLFVLGSS